MYIPRILVSSLLTVHKYYSDFFFMNRYFAECLGEDLRMLNFWEGHFLKTLDYRITVRPSNMQASTSILVATALTENSNSHVHAVA